MVKLSLFNNKTELLKTDAYALYLATRDPRTPWLAKVIAVLVVGYALSPIDLVPDFIPVIGWIDDLLIMGLGMRILKNLIPPNVWQEAKEKAAPVESKIRRAYRITIWTLIIIWAFLVIIAAIAVVFIVRYLQRHV